MDICISHHVLFDEIEVEYDASRPDPETGDGWDITIRKVTCLVPIDTPNNCVDIGAWIGLRYADEIRDYIIDELENE